MKLDDIADKVEKDHRWWARERLGQLDAVCDKKEIAKQIVTFIEEASKLRNRPVHSIFDAKVNVGQCLKHSALANFRFGLTIGLMLDEDRIQELESKLKECPFSFYQERDTIHDEDQDKAAGDGCEDEDEDYS